MSEITNQSMDELMSDSSSNSSQDANSESQSEGILSDYAKASNVQRFISKKKKSVALLVFMCIASLYVFITLILGYNFLAAVGVALSMITSVLIFVSVLFKKQIHLYLWITYVVLTGGSLLIFSAWGAEGFGKSLGYNLLLTFVPLGASVVMFFLDAIFRKNMRAQRIVSILLSLLLILCSLMYFLSMSMRMRPTVKSMQKGHDEYLNNIKNSGAKQNSPNVLFILMDDMAYSDISCYSYLNKDGKAPTINTPTLDALAEEGVSFENFYSCSPVCSPSRFGILTGRYASRGYLDNVIFPTTVSLNPFGSTRYLNPFQFYNNVDGILGDEITVAEVLHAAGYNTALIGKWNLGDYGEYLPTNQGFDYFYGSYYVNDMTPYNMVREVGGVAEEVHSHWDMLDQSETTRILTEELNGYISTAAEQDNPFFAYYCTPWPHYPIFSGEKYDTTDDSYIACIEEFDAYLGTTIQLLKDKGVYDDTLIIFTSDNGPGREGVTGALRGRKNTTFDGGHKVPLIMSYPKSNISAPKSTSVTNLNIITTNTMNIDLFPTILQYAGITAMPQDRIIDGRSLYNLLEDTDGTYCNDPDYRVHDALFYIKKGKVQGVQMPIEYVDKNGNTVKHDFKYFDKVRTENSAFIDQMYKNYLFNLTLDPAEGYNVSMTYPDIASTLNKKLNEFRKQLKSNRRGIVK